MYKASVEYVYTWKLPLQTTVARRLRLHYDLVRQEGAGRLYRRKPPRRPAGTAASLRR